MQISPFQRYVQCVTLSSPYGQTLKLFKKKFCIGNLPSEWHTQNWPTLLVLCCDYFHCILKREPSSDGSVINPVDV
jgi:hypothetical protein